MPNKIVKAVRRHNVTELNNCVLCPRQCGADRAAGSKGICQMDARVTLARASLHMWEEPCISGKKGSGAVFFSGCPLGCIFCQNRDIASARAGRAVTVEHLAHIFLDLQDQGAANLNLVTGVHFVPQIIEALDLAREQGLSLPVVYNSGGYEKKETLGLLSGYVDVYLPDFKYMDASLAARFSHAADYPEAAREAVSEMVRQTGPCVFDEEGYIRKGTIVRHLILPGHTKDSCRILDYLLKTYGDDIYISLMNQYTPMSRSFPWHELNRKLTRREYEKVLTYALEHGLTNGFFQEGETARESFIPPFDLTGV